MGKKDDGNDDDDDDDNDDIAINCDGNGAVIRCYLATVGAHVGENTERSGFMILWVIRGRRRQSRGGAAAAIMVKYRPSIMMMLFCGMCLCVLCVVCLVVRC